MMFEREKETGKRGRCELRNTRIKKNTIDISKRNNNPWL
jgi:hypothetical protein